MVSYTPINVLAALVAWSGERMNWSGFRRALGESYSLYFGTEREG